LVLAFVVLPPPVIYASHQTNVLAKNTSQMSHNTAQWVNQMALCRFL
jgi:hypothetical protein